MPTTRENNPEAILTGEEMAVIRGILGDFIQAGTEALDLPSLSITLGVWTLVVLDLMKANKDHPHLEIQTLMNRITISHSSFLN